MSEISTLLKTRIRYYGLTLLLCFAGIDFAGFSQSSKGRSGHPEAGMVKLANSPGSIENMDLRNEFSRTFDNPDGSHTKQQGLNPMHYKDDKGRWMTIQKTPEVNPSNAQLIGITRTDLPVSVHTGNGVSTMFLKKDKKISFGQQAKMLWMSADGISKTVSQSSPAGHQLSDNVLSLKSLFPKVDRKQTFDYDHLRTDYILNESPDLSASVEYVVLEDIVSLPAGWKISYGSGEMTTAGWKGDLDIRDENNIFSGKFSIPVFYDAFQGSRSQMGGHVVKGTYKIAPATGGYKIQIWIPAAWLNAPGRVYPVTIDPTVSGVKAQYGNVNGYAYSASCQETLTINVPSGTITNTASTYSITAQNGAYRSEQVSRVGSGANWSANQTNTTNSGGTYNYSLPTLTIANGAWCGGNKVFTWQAYRTWDADGFSDCDQYNQYRSGNWVVDVTYSAVAAGPPASVGWTAPSGGAPSAPTCGNWSGTWCSGSGTYTDLTLVQGVNYTVENTGAATCGTALSTAYLQAWWSGGSTACSYGSIGSPAANSFSFDAQISGGHRIGVTSNTCGAANTCGGGLGYDFSGASAVLRYRQNTTVTNTTSAADLCLNATRSLSATLGGAHNNPTIGWTVVSGGGSIAGTTYTPSAAGSVTIRATVGNCTSDVTFNVVDPAATTVAVSGTTNICAGGSTVLTASGGSTYSWSPATGLSATTGTSVTASPGATQVYTVSETSGACISSGTVTVTVGALVTPTFSAVGPICSGAALAALPTTSTNGITGTWSPALDNTNTTTYTFTPDAGQCASTTTMTITVNPNVTPTFTPVAAICAGDAVSALPTTSTNGITGTWSPAIDNMNTTTYTFTPDAGQCATTTTMSITVKSLPTAAIAASATGICPGETVTLTASGGTTYSWSPSTGLDATTGAVVHASPTTTQTYTVTATDNGCNDTETVTITVTPLVVTVVSDVSSVCAGESATITASGAVTYSWTPATGLNTTTGNEVIASPSATQTYTVTGTDGACQGTQNITITVKTNPTVSVTPSSANLCSGNSITLTGVGASSYVWLPTLSSGPTVTVSPTTTTTYTALGTAANGCVGQGTATVTVTTPPSATISYAGLPYCTSISTPQTVTRTGTSGGTYTASPAGLSINASTGAITPSTSSAGTYTVTYTVAASGGCAMYTTTTSVTVNAVPTATINYPGSPFCGDLSTPQNVSRTGASGGTYSSTAGLILDPASGAVTPSTSTPGTYTVTYTIAAASGCPAVTATASVTVTAPPSAAVSYTGTPYCTSLTSAQPVTHTGTTGGTYTALPAGLSINASTGAITPSASSPGTYTVTYTVLAANGCPTYTTTASLTINAIPTATITYPGSPFCGNLSAAQNVAQTGTAGGTYTSTAGLTLDPVSGAITPSTSTAGTYTVTYTIAAGSGCPAVTATTSVTITTPPSATISYASPFCTSTSAAQAVTHTGTNGGTYSSTAGLTINATTGAITPSTSTAGTYTVTYTIAAAGGCPVYTTTASVTITAMPTATITYTGSPFCGNLSSPQNVSLTGTTGGTYTSTAGLTINAATGAITPSTSTAGTYTVTYTIAAAGGCAAVTATTSVTVTPAPTATISYASPFCTSVSAAQAVSHTGTTGGSYSASPAGLTINASTGAITPSSSTAGTYAVTYTVAASGGCPVYTVTTSVTINPVPTATISYSGTPFCGNLSAPQSVTQTGTTGGTYTSTAGLSINAATGEITPSASTAGTYTVTYTIAASGGCAAVTATTSVTINPAPTAAISYAGSPFCSTAGTQTVTQTGTGGGVYSSTAGLTISAVNGTITPSSSIAGTYTVTYTIAAANGCPATTATTTVTINPIPTAAISYSGTPFCGNLSTAQNVTQTGTAGGTYTSTAGLSINAATGAITPSTSTPGTYTVTYTIAAGSGCPAVTATASVTINAAPSATISYASPFCTSTTAAQSVTRTGTAGGSYTASPAGLTINASTGAITPSTSTAGTYTVTYTVAAGGGCPVYTTTATVTINALPTATISYSGTPYCGNLSTAQNVTQTGAAGGTYTSTTGLSINAATGAITPSTSTAGTYTVTYTIAAGSGCPAVTATTSVTITTPPSATISYTGSPFCSTAGVQSVTQTGAAGGVYSSTPGLTISATTGAITPSSSIAGTYTVTYTIAAANGCPATTVTTTVTINPLPTAGISYSGSPFCSSLGVQNVNQTGTAGGTYSASPAGLTINASTGAITPSTSTAGTYTITYTIAAGSGCPAVTATASVTITALPVATIAYAGSPYCTTLTTAQAITHTGTTGGTYSASPAGLTINASTGAITPSTSTAGTYTVTYTIAAGSGCPAVTSTASVTITTAPSATISYAGSPFCSTVTSAQAVTQTGTTGGTYSASPAGLTIDASTGAVTPSTSTAGTYTVTYNVAAGSGCAALSVTTSVTINAAPTATIAYSAAQFCSSIPSAQPAILTGTSGGTYSASPAGLSIDATTGAITPSLSTPGNYTVTYNVNPPGCGSLSATAAVEIVLSPTASITYAGPYCASVPTAQPVTLTGTGNYTGGTYSASPAGLSINATTGEITPNLSTAGTYLVTYTVPASSGCSAGTATVNVTITATPSATISYAGSPFCSNVAGAQPVTFTGSTGGAYSSTAGLTINASTGAITPSTSTAGSYVVTYTTLPSGSCPPGTATSTIVILATPSVNDLADQTLCDLTYTLPAITGTSLTGNELYFTAPNGGGTSYAAGDVISATTQLYIYDANGSCTDEESVLITINQTPVITNPGNQTACGSYTLPAIAGTNLSGSEAYYNNSQTLGGTVITGPITSSQTVWIYDTNGNCSDEESFTVTINSIPDASFTATDYCGGTGNAPVVTGVSGGTFSFNPAVTDGATIDPSTGLISAGVDGTTYTVEYTVSGACPSSSQEQVTFNAVPASPVAGTNATYCSAQTFAPMTATAGAGGTLNWYNDAALTNQVGTGTSVTPANTTGLTTYYVTETVNGCQSLPSTVDITVNPSPAEPGVSSSVSYCKGDTISNLTATGIAGSTFNWYEDAALTIPYGTGSSVTPLDVLGAKTYYVTQTGSGCESEAASVTVTINDCFELEVITAFTPGDGDNVNNTWEIPELNARYPNCNVTIFNRWGQILFESNGYTTPWDGKYNGEYLPVGSYYYIIKLNDADNTPNVKGTVTIIRN